MKPDFEMMFENQKAESARIHELAYVDSPCRIGEHTEVMPFTHIMAHSIIGDNCLIGHNVTISPGVMIANNVRVMNSTLLNSGVILEDDVYCGPATVFTENRLMRAQPRSISRISPTLVRQGAKIGANTTIGSGFTIGRFSFVEAGSVIDSHVPDFAVVYGNPVKFAGWQCTCGRPLQTKPAQRASQQRLACDHCGNIYEQPSRYKLVLLTSQEAETRAIHYPDSRFDPSVPKTQAGD